MTVHLPAIHDKEAIYAALLAKVAPAENIRAGFNPRPALPHRQEANIGQARASAHAERRRKISDMRAAGMSAAEIAAATGYSRRCVVDHISAIAAGHNLAVASGYKKLIIGPMTMRILRALDRADDWMTYDEVSDRAGATMDAAFDAMKKAHRNGLVDRREIGGGPGGGKRRAQWRLTPEGREAVRRLA